MHGHPTAPQSALPPRPPPAIWRPPVSQHAIVNHPWARDTLLFARPASPPHVPPSPQRPQPPVSVVPPGASDIMPTVTTVQTAAEMEARDGRPARRVTLSDYSFLQERHEEDAAGVHLATALPPRTASNRAVVTTAPVPVAPPVPTIAPSIATLATTIGPRSRANAEPSPPEPTFCLSWSWCVPGWLSSCFFDE